MSDAYEGGEFVQVHNVLQLFDGKAQDYWRNALYVEGDEASGSHVVQYADGSREAVLNNRLRRYQNNEQ